MQLPNTFHTAALTLPLHSLRERATEKPETWGGSLKGRWCNYTWLSRLLACGGYPTARLQHAAWRRL